jgi:RNA polymerase sigma-70 factor, ECF subfamily
MTDPEAAVAGRATQPTHVARAGRSAPLVGRKTGDAAAMGVLYDEHGAALWRYAMRLAGDRSRAEDVVQETLLRAWQHPEVVDDSEWSARSWLFTVARNMIIDERRSARFRKEVSPLDGSGVPEHAGPDEVNAALDRMLIGDAMAELSAEHRAVIRRSYYLGWSTSQIAKDLGIGHRKIEVALCRAGAAAHTAGKGVTR